MFHLQSLSESPTCSHNALLSCASSCFLSLEYAFSRFHTHSDHRFDSDGEIFFIECQDVVEGKGNLDKVTVRADEIDLATLFLVEEGSGHDGGHES